MRSLIILLVCVGIAASQRSPTEARKLSEKEIEALNELSSFLDHQRLSFEDAKYRETNLRVGPRKLIACLFLRLKFPLLLK